MCESPAPLAVELCPKAMDENSYTIGPTNQTRESSAVIGSYVPDAIISRRLDKFYNQYVTMERQDSTDAKNPINRHISPAERVTHHYAPTGISHYTAVVPH